MSTVHWVGAGLASGPGIVSLANKHQKIVVWDMTSDRADMLKSHLNEGAAFSFSKLDLRDASSVAVFKTAIAPHDVVVSMLPAALHVELANIALERKAHLVTSSYVSPEMAVLDTRAKEVGVALVNEVGLDPGIDHLFAHLLVDAAKEAGVLGKGHAVEFVSYCGGVPAEETDFTYKFAWTPYGVLTALKNQARLIDAGEEKIVAKAWEDVSELSIDNEVFEVYANRDSLPYVEEYGLEAETNIKKFVRGTLRLQGWKKAWANVFEQVDKATPDDLKELSDRLWSEHAYGEAEEDRVVMYVALSVTKDDGSVWEASLALDEKGSGWKTAMAATVSKTVAEAVMFITKSAMTPGIHAAITCPNQCRIWLAGLQAGGIKVRADNVNL
ncbi:MAG: saccharopine dehydrogenase family protein [Kordiimonas sp.]